MSRKTMDSHRWLSIILAIGTTTAVALITSPRAGWANRARKASLVDTYAIQDEEDVFVFPGLAATYGHRYQMTLGETPTGAMLFGRESEPVWGIGVNRPRSMDNLDGVDDLAVFANQHGALSPKAIPSGGEFATVLFALPNRLGFRLSHTWHREAQVSVSNNEQTTTSFSYNGLEAAIGWSSKRDQDFVFDTVLAARLNLLRIREADEISFETSGPPSVNIGGRGFWRLDGPVVWTALLTATARNYSGADVNSSLMSIRAGTGPRLDIGDRVQVASTGSVGVASLTANESNANLRSTELAFALPGFDLAVDARVLEWLDLRWGFQSRFVIDSQIRKNTENDNETRASQTKNSMGGMFGVGINYWDFSLDAHLGADRLFQKGKKTKFLVSVTYAPSDQSIESPPPKLGEAPSPYPAEAQEETEQGGAKKAKASQDQSSSKHSESGESGTTTKEKVARKDRETGADDEGTSSSEKKKEAKEAAFAEVRRAAERLRKAASVGLKESRPRLYGRAETKLEQARTALRDGRYDSARATAGELVGTLEKAIEREQQEPSRPSSTEKRSEGEGGAGGLQARLSDKFSGRVATDGGAVVLTLDGLFKSKSSDLESEGREQLAELATILSKALDHTLVIEAGAPEDFDESLRKRLGRARAAAVRDRLEEAGLSSERIDSVEAAGEPGNQVRIRFESSSR